MKQPALSPAIQDYLRAIYRLSVPAAGSGRVSTSRIAGWLAVRPASVTAMLRRMAANEPALVDYHKNYGARLTPAGERAALAVVRNHRLLELFLHEKLGFTWDEVHEEADRLEHVVSEAMIERLDQSLGRPSHDPHGHAIPTASLSVETLAVMPLNRLPAGDSAVIHSINDDDPALLRLCDRAGIRPGVVVKAVKIGQEALYLFPDCQEAKPIPLEPAVTSQVFVQSGS